MNMCVVPYTVISVGFKTSFDLYFSMSWSGALYKVYGTFIFVPDLDLGTSGLEPNTDCYYTLWLFLFVVYHDLISMF